MKLNKLLATVTACFCIIGSVSYNVEGILKTSLYTVAADANETVDKWDGTVDKSWYDENKTQFDITTAEQLAGLVELNISGNTFKGKIIYLENNFDFSNTAALESMDTFEGSIGGLEHSITGLKNPFINKNTGMIVATSFKSNISAQVTSKSQSIGVIANESSGDIMNCNVSGSITCNTPESQTGMSYPTYDTSYIGGVCGTQNSGRISNCTSYVNIIRTTDRHFSTMYIGGICGNSLNAEIRDCTYSSGTINATATPYQSKTAVYTNKVVSVDNSNKKIYYDCYCRSDNVDSKQYVGGICGNASSTYFYSCKNAGTINCTNKIKAGATPPITYNTGETILQYVNDYGNTYYNLEKWYRFDSSNDGNPTVTVETRAGGVCGNAAFANLYGCSNSGSGKTNVGTFGKICGYKDANTIIEDKDPTIITTTSTTTTTKTTTTTTTTPPTTTVTTIASISSNSTTSVNSNEEVKSWSGGYDTSWYDDEETEFYIKTAEQLAGLVKLTNGMKKDFSGKVVILDSDIYLNKSGDKTNKWTPIGEFKGTFDGNNHRVYNLYIYPAYGGLFGKNVDTVKNLNIVNAEIDSYAADIGGICNKANNIVNCYFNGIIKATSTSSYGQKVAGICISAVNISECISNYSLYNGQNKSFMCGGICISADKIDRCFNLKSLINDFENTSGQFAGICVNGGNATITNCANYGSEISGSKYTGGICSTINSATISNCYNLGLIQGQMSGGIVGYIKDNSKAKISNVYNYNRASGAIYGGKSATATVSIEKAYYYAGNGINGVSGASDPEGVIAKSLDKMKTKEFTESIGDAFVYVTNEFPQLAYEKENEHLRYRKPSWTFSTAAPKDFKELIWKNIDNGITWTSSNAEIASVDSNGVVKPLKTGNVLIYATYGESKITFDVVIKSGFDIIPGDVNCDGDINIADAVSLQNFLLGRTKTLGNWKNADLCKDNRIDVFDMVLMRRLLIEKMN